MPAAPAHTFIGNRVMQDWLEPLAGGSVLAITLLDVFLTVLFARAGAGLLAPRLARGVWRTFCRLSRGRRGGLLDYCGPVQLVALVLMWGALLSLGAGLMIQPALGTGVKSSSGATDADFVTALFVGGSSMSIVGTSDYGPVTAGYKLLFLLDSLVGMSVTTLTLTYLMQVYTALRARNTLSLTLHAQSGGTGDAAELLARWGPRGRFDAGYNTLSALAGDMVAVKEAHHFYPMLFYFRFEDPSYATARFLLLALDAAALVHTALDAHELGWLQESAAVAELEQASELLLRTLNDNFPTRRDDPTIDAAGSAERWRRRHAQAVQRLQAAGIATRLDTEAGARDYVELRGRWERDIEALAPALGYPMEDVDPAVSGGRARALDG